MIPAHAAAVRGVWLLLGRRRVWGALVLAGAFLLSSALAAAGLFAALTAGGRRGLRIALTAFVAAILVLVFRALAFGYDPVHAVLATRDQYERGIGGRRSHWYWTIGGPAAFLIVLGPLIAERLLFAVERGGRAARALAVCVIVGGGDGGDGGGGGADLAVSRATCRRRSRTLRDGSSLALGRHRGRSARGVRDRTPMGHDLLMPPS